jgi:two-component system LytT family sensor kinase
VRLSGDCLSPEQDAAVRAADAGHRAPAGKLVCYLVFSGFCVMGTYLGFQIEGAIANTRAIGAVLGAFSADRSSDSRSALPAVCTAIRSAASRHRPVRCRRLIEGLIGGGLHLYLLRRHRAEQLLNPMIALGTTLFAE